MKVGDLVQITTDLFWDNEWIFREGGIGIIVEKPKTSTGIPMIIFVKNKKVPISCHHLRKLNI